jgi:diguanylate cyclase (GGDEF)-like protein
MPTRAGSITSALASLARRVLASESLEAALQATADVALELVPADHASVRLVDTSGVRLTVGARAGRGAKLSALPLQKGEGIAGWVLERAEPARVDDAETDPRFARVGGQGFAIRSMLAEPMWSGGHVIGVVSVSSPEPHAFADEDALSLRVLACCAVQPIERARGGRTSSTDELTLALVEEQLVPCMVDEMWRAKNAGAPLSVLALDVDGLDKVNERFSRDVGDRVLRIVADRVRARVRVFDPLVRRGGDELVLVLQSTGLDAAEAVAALLRRDIGEVAMEPLLGAQLSQTVSVAVATWNGDEAALTLLARLGEGLLLAKRGGGFARSPEAAPEKSDGKGGPARRVVPAKKGKTGTPPASAPGILKSR